VRRLVIAASQRGHRPLVDLFSAHSRASQTEVAARWCTGVHVFSVDAHRRRAEKPLGQGGLGSFDAAQLELGAVLGGQSLGARQHAS